MIDYEQTEVGDILRLSMNGLGAPGFACRGELLRVTAKKRYGIEVERKNGERADFLLTCGAARLETTEWKGEFPPNVPLVPQAGPEACRPIDSPTPAGEGWEGTPATSMWLN